MAQKQLGVGAISIHKVIDGKSNFMFVKYSADNASAPMLDKPNGTTKYIGVAVSPINSAPTNKADYTWSLFIGEDGQDSFTWIRYSENENGFPMTSTPTADTKYIGITVSTTPTLPTYDKFTWSRYVGYDGKDGSDGRDGTPGTDGAPGRPGADGKTYYTHIAYSNSADGTKDFSTTNSNREYIGMCVDENKADPTTPASYSWSKIKGMDGANGVPGKPGSDGRTPYFHVAYANSSDGKLDFSTTNGNDKQYIGQYTDFVESDSTDPTKYTWTRIKGRDGIDGKPGKDGVGISSTDISYQIGDSGSSQPVGTWSPQVPALVKGKYLWTRMIWTYTDGTDETGYTATYISKDGNNGNDGLPGKDGVGIVNTIVKYATNASGITPPVNGWDAQVPTVVPGNYLWTQTTWFYSDDTSEVGYSVSRMGVDGKDGKDGINGKDGTPGAQGAPGAPGKDGKTYYTHIAYANSADGKTDFSTTDANREYVGMCVDEQLNDPITPASYKWSKIKGLDGTDGIPGKAGADGKTPYFHVAYANSADGKLDFSTSDSVGKVYIGQYTDYTQADSTDPTKYSWTMIKGADGQSIVSVVQEFYLSTSKDAPIGGSWKSLPDQWIQGKYQWTRNKITYKNPSKVEYTNAVIDSSWEAIDNIEIGNRNLLLGTDKGLINGNPSSRSYSVANPQELIDGLNRGEEYALGVYFSIKNAQRKEGVNFFRVVFEGKIEYTDGTTWWPSLGYVFKEGETVEGKRISVVIKKPAGKTIKEIGYGSTFGLHMQANGDESLAKEAILVKGNKIGNWSPAPEDTQTTIKDIYATLDVQKGQIALKAGQTEVNNLTGQVNKLDSEVKVMAGEIALKVSEDQISNTVNDSVGEYYLSTSKTSLVGGSWSTTAPQAQPGKYMWTRTRITQRNGVIKYSPNANGVCIAGADGQDGKNGAQGPAGANGTNGQGLQSITPEYYLSTSKATQSGGSWKTIQDLWTPNKYMWTRNKVVYVNPAKTEYTPPVIDTSWEAIDNIDIGVRNLYKTSKKPLILDAGETNNYKYDPIFQPAKIDQDYSISAKVKFLKGSSPSITLLILNTDIGSGTQRVDIPIQEGKIKCSIRTLETAPKIAICLYAGYAGKTANNSVEFTEIMLTEGNKVVGYQPAPEEEEAERAKLASEIKLNKDQIALESSRITSNKTEIGNLTTKYNQINATVSEVKDNSATKGELQILSDQMSLTVKQTEFNTVKDRLNNLGVSTTNLILNSHIEIQNNGYNLVNYPFDKDKVKVGDEFVAIVWGELPPGRTRFGFFFKSGGYPITGGAMKEISSGLHVVSGKISGEPTDTISLYAIPNSGEEVHVEKVMLIKGNVIPSEWTPSPKDQSLGSTNLIAQSKLIRASYVNGTGGINANYPASNLTDFYPMSSVDKYFMQIWNPTKGTLKDPNVRISYWNASKGFISRTDPAVALGTKEYTLYEIPYVKGTAYIRVHFPSEEFLNVMLTKGSMYPTTWSPAPEDTTVGTRNLLLNTRNFGSGWNSKSVWTESGKYQGLTVFKREDTWNGIYQPFTVEKGKTYTFSSWIKADAIRDDVKMYSSVSGKAMFVNPDTSFPPITTEWTRYSWTGTAIESGEVRFRIENSVKKAGVLTYIAGYMLTEGRTAVDWSPAPEDMENQILDTNNKINTVDKNLTDKINNIAIGSRNLLLQTAKKTLNKPDSTGIAMWANQQKIIDHLNSGKPITMAFNVDVVNSVPRANGQNRAVIEFSFTDQSDKKYYVGVYKNFTSGETFSGRCTATYTKPSNISAIKTINGMGYHFQNSATSASLTEIMTVYGDKIGDWQPAPEDTQNMINEAIADINITPEGIVNTVMSSTQWTDFEASQESNFGEVQKRIEQVASTSLTKDMFEVSIDNIQSQVDGNTEVSNKVSSFMQFKEDGLTIGKSTSPFKVRLGNESLDFLENNQRVAFLSRETLFITKAEITQELIIGDYVVAAEEGQVSFYWRENQGYDNLMI